MKKSLMLVCLFAFVFILVACKPNQSIIPTPKGEELSQDEAVAYLSGLDFETAFTSSSFFEVILKSKTKIEFNVESESSYTYMDTIYESSYSSAIDIDSDVEASLRLNHVENVEDALLQVEVKGDFAFDMTVNSSSHTAIDRSESMAASGNLNLYVHETNMYLDTNLRLEQNNQEVTYRAKNKLDGSFSQYDWNSINPFNPSEIPGGVPSLGTSELEALFEQFSTVNVYKDGPRYQVYLSFDKNSLIETFSSLFDVAAIDELENEILDAIEKFEFQLYLEIEDGRFNQLLMELILKADGSFDETSENSSSHIIVKIDSVTTLEYRFIDRLPNFPDFSQFTPGNPNFF